MPAVYCIFVKNASRPAHYQIMRRWLSDKIFYLFYKIIGYFEYRKPYKKSSSRDDMSDLADLCYQQLNDTPAEINRYFGFFRKQKAAQAKHEIAQGLTGLILAAHGSVDGEVTSTSWYWVYNTDSLTAVVGSTTLEISLGARHRRKATKGLPYAGIFSELVVNIFPYDNPQQFMQSSLAAQMKEYLSCYGTERIT